MRRPKHPTWRWSLKEVRGRRTSGKRRPTKCRRTTKRNVHRIRIHATVNEGPTTIGRPIEKKKKVVCHKCEEDREAFFLFSCGLGRAKCLSCGEEFEVD